MSKTLALRDVDEDRSDINLTPMLDVVFILLIFFIVTATFIRETGIDVNRDSDDRPPETVPANGAILIVIDDEDQIIVDGRAVDPRAVRAHVRTLSQHRGRSGCNGDGG